jgi:hypothetical protein
MNYIGAFFAFGFDAGPELELVLAGGYALAAHEVVDRPSKDIDFATATKLPMPEVITRLSAAYRDKGDDVTVVECTARMARMIVSTDFETCEVDVLKEAIGPPAVLSIGPVLSFDDAVGLKIRALHEQAAHGDFVDAYAASGHMSTRQLEILGARHTPGFSLDDLADRLGLVHELDEQNFAAYGSDRLEIRGLRAWAVEWESDIRAPVAAGEDGPPRQADDEWDTYLDRT